MKFSATIVFLKNLLACALALSVFGLGTPATATTKTQHNPIIDAANRQQDAFDAALNVSTPGPAKINLGDQGILNLPENYFYIPAREAANLLHMLGNKTGPEFLGLVISKDHIHWFITIDFIPSGYIKDAATPYWNNENLLSDLRQSTADENQQSGGALEVMNWIEEPRYDAFNHRLLWSALTKSQNDTSDSNHQSVNYNAYLLGREGYFDLDLITSNAAISDDKVHIKTLLPELTFLPGKRYEDFNKKTDAVADYDITTLITDRVSKINYFKLANFIFVRTWKVILLCFALWLVIARRLVKFKIKQAETALENEF